MNQTKTQNCLYHCQKYLRFCSFTLSILARYKVNKISGNDRINRKTKKKIFWTEYSGQSAVDFFNIIK